MRKFPSTAFALLSGFLGLSHLAYAEPLNNTASSDQASHASKDVKNASPEGAKKSNEATECETLEHYWAQRDAIYAAHPLPGESEFLHLKPYKWACCEKNKAKP